MSELLARDLAVGYGKTPLISEICLRVRSGEIVAVVGPNGAGKTTLLKTVAGLLEPQGGAVFLDSQDFKTVRPSERARRIAVMTTARAAAEFATCRDVVSVGRYQFTGVMGRLSAADRAAVDEALQTVGAQELSGADSSRARSRRSPAYSYSTSRPGSSTSGINWNLSRRSNGSRAIRRSAFS